MFSCTKQFKRFKKYDIFGHPIALTMKNEDSYKTVFGGILTIGIVIFFFSIVIFSFYKLFTQQNLLTAKYELNLGASYGFLDLNDQNFMLAIRFDQNVLNNWIKPFMNITLMHVTQFRNTSTVWKTKTKIGLKPCKSSDFSGLNEEFEQLGLNTSLCPAPGSNLTLQGNYQENTFVYFQLILTTCTNNLTCQDNETIYREVSKIDKINIQFFITNNVIDERNYEEPIKRQITSDMHFLIDPIKAVYRTADLFLNEIEIITDRGYTPTMFSDIILNKTYTYNQEFREQVIFTALQGSEKVNIADFYFRKSQKKYKYDRFIGNLLTILSYLGGIWSTCYICFMFLSKSYSQYFFINCLSNKLYNYPSQMKKKIIKKPTIIIEKTRDIDIEGRFASVSPQRKTIFAKLIEKIEIYLSYDRKLKYSFCEMWKFLLHKLLFFFTFTDEKTILMNKSKNNLIRDLDICNILKKLHELDKIKELLFSEEQQLMLGFSPKPEIISSDVDPSLFEIASTGIRNLSKSIKQRKKKKQRLLEEEVNFNEIQPFKQLIFAWRSLKNSKQNTFLINENLVKMFGEEFSKIVDVTEEEMQIFCDQQKTAGNNFFQIVKGIKKNEPERDRMNELKLNKFNENQRNYSLHSEDFLDCPENNEKIILGFGNKLEKVVTMKRILSVKNLLNAKMKSVKEKLGLNLINKNREIVNKENKSKKPKNSEDFLEFGENCGDIFSQRETIVASTGRSEKKEVHLIKKNIVFKSVKVDHEDDENQTKEEDASKGGGKHLF